MQSAARLEQYRVLVVDDDEQVRTLVAWQLEAEGFGVTGAADGAAALQAVEADPPDLIVLDLSMPHVDGLDVLTRLRRTSRIPVIVLTGRSGETDRIVGLDLGADDYLVKPFSPGELAARVRSVLRRATPEAPSNRLEFGALAIDTTTREVHLAGTVVELTAKEFDLLAFLARAPRQVFTREQLLKRVWGAVGEWQDSATVTQHVHRLRHKLEADPGHPRWLRTVRGVGYRFEP
ncbi:MAG: response regulator transcription factor [Sporichthyaceae bacterium]|jgi:two-component system phosphate regulon response regulator PhoB